MRFAIFAIGLLGLGGPAFAADDPAAAAQGTFEKWIEVRDAIAREQRDWTVEKEFLTEEIRLLKEEVAALKEKSERLATETSQTEKDLARIAGSNEALKAAATRVETGMAGFESALRSLEPRFPGILRETLEPLMRRVPREGAAIKASLSERMQVVVGFLSQVDKFNGALTVVPELRKKPDGKEVQVRTLYLGLAQAWFVSLDGEFAGHGISGAAGWEWTTANEIAPAVKLAIDIQQNAGIAQYVRLPVNVNPLP